MVRGEKADKLDKMQENLRNMLQKKKEIDFGCIGEKVLEAAGHNCQEHPGGPF